MRQAATFSLLLAAVAGFLIWASAFGTLYALFSIGCIQGWHEPRVAGLPLWQVLLLGDWFVHIAAHVGLVFWSARHLRSQPARGDGMPHFLTLTTVAVAVAALLATLWTGLPVVLVSTCV